MPKPVDNYNSSSSSVSSFDGSELAGPQRMKYGGDSFRGPINGGNVGGRRNVNNNGRSAEESVKEKLKRIKALVNDKELNYRKCNEVKAELIGIEEDLEKWTNKCNDYLEIVQAKLDQYGTKKRAKAKVTGTSTKVAAKSRTGASEVAESDSYQSC